MWDLNLEASSGDHMIHHLESNKEMNLSWIKGISSSENEGKLHLTNSITNTNLIIGGYTGREMSRNFIGY